MRRETNKASRIAGVLSFALLTAASYGQSFNLDLDIFGGGPENGNGAPSSQFGGAAGQVGFWNRVVCTSPGPSQVLNLSGGATSIVMRATNAGAGSGSPFPPNTGDFALLLNDGANIPDTMTYTFSGLAPGAYSVYCYAVNVTGEAIPVSVSVDGAIQGTEIVTGPMPGNSFGYLITHSIHDIPSLNGDLVFRLAGAWPRAEVNGFQVVAVPETGSILVLAVGGIALRFGGKV